MATSLAVSTPAAQWARYYGRKGWRSFPVWPGEKRPMYAGWQKDATTDPTLLDQYFRDPTRNVGVVCGEGFEAWDIEVEHVDRFTNWLKTNGYVLPEGPIASTGRGGLHFLTEPTGVDGTRRLHLDGVHIGELKSRGGFILVSPSVTEQVYRWTWLPDNLHVSPAPDWLRGLLERPVALTKHLPTRLASPDDVVNVLGRLAGSVQYAGEGSRNNYLYWAIRRAIEEGIPVKYAVSNMRAAARDAGLPAHEIEQTVESAVAAESVAV